MKVTVQVVTTTDDGQESIHELACIEREDLTAESLESAKFPGDFMNDHSSTPPPTIESP